MTTRFLQVGVNDFSMYTGVSPSDPRISPLADPHTQRCHSCMLGHLDMILNFINNDSRPYGIFCEDDILINSNFSNSIEGIIQDFETQNLDVLLLGYLCSYIIEAPAQYQNGTYRYYDYDMHTWGTQMYMLSRAQAKFLINKYTCTDAPVKYNPFSADWTITKEGNKRCVYPMLAIEDGKGTYADECQSTYHALSHSAHLETATYV